MATPPAPEQEEEGGSGARPGSVFQASAPGTGRGLGAALRRTPALRPWNGPGTRRLPEGTRSLSWAGTPGGGGRAGGMELDGLLLDEEGTFSLSGFQDFTVSVPGRTPTGARCPRPSPLPPQAPGALLLGALTGPYGRVPG